MLAGNNNTFQSHWFSIFIFYCYLCFSIRKDIFDISASSASRKFTCDPVCQNSRHWHKLRSLIARISDHNTLISSSPASISYLCTNIIPKFFRHTHCFRNIWTLLVYKRIHFYSICTISAFFQNLSDHIKYWRLISAADFSCHKHISSCGKDFTCHSRRWIITQTFI